MQVRIHAALGRLPWAKLWYYCRALDDRGSGKIVLNLHSALYDLGVTRSCIYNWIERGKKCGAFRATYRQGSMWTLYLGSLHNVCRRLGLPDWGATFSIAIENLPQIRQITTAAITFNLQEQSRGEAIRNLTPQERKVYRVPEAFEILTSEGKLQRKLTSQNTPSPGATVPYLLWVSERKAFVSKSFVPFGGSQKTIADRLGVCDRTVRRHHVGLGIVKRQLCQTKAEYAALHDEIARFGNAYINESNGLSQRSTHQTEMTEGKTFKMLGRTWVNRCNLYLGNLEWTSMRASKRDYLKSYGIDWDREIWELRQMWRHMGMPSREFWRSDFLKAHKACLWESVRAINFHKNEPGGGREGVF